MFENCSNTNLKGNVALGMCISYLTQKGYIVSLPLNDSQKYDLIYDDGIKLNKVQIKATSQKANGSFKVKLETCSHNFNESFNSKDNDYLFIICEDGTRYFIPTGEIVVKTSLALSKKWDKFKI